MAKLTRNRPHSRAQHNFITLPGDIVAMAGRRWGKTTAGVWRLERNAINNPYTVNWWVGLSWRSASLGVAQRLIQEFHTSVWALKRQKPDKHRSLIDKIYTFPNNSVIAMRTAERPDSLAGEGVSMAVMDEFSLMKEKVWTEYVEGTLLDKPGTACFIGVPKGNNWASQLWRQAVNRDGWHQMHFTSYDNPIMREPEQAARLEDARKNSSARMFDQEYLAKILDGAGLVFKNVTECCTATWVKSAKPDTPYVFGIDWGKQHDYTVVTVFDVHAHSCVYYERFNGISYHEQLRNIRNMVGRFSPRHIVAETNSMGEALIDQLQADGLPVRRFTTTAQSKRKIIEQLAVAFENYDIQIPSSVEDDGVMINELTTFESEVKGTTIKYSAPEGENSHDDIVMSMAFAWSSVNADTGVTF